MKNILKVFLSSLLSGFFIGVGATIFLVLTSEYNMKVLGSFMFGIGLYSIIIFNLWLFTGKIGYVFEHDYKFLISLFVCLIGNLIGISLLSLSLKGTNVISENVVSLAKSIVNTKENESRYELLSRSIMCGVMIFLAVEGHKKCENPVGKILFAFMPISLFILCGFEHVVANACYYTYSGVSFSWNIVLHFFIMAVGDSLGSILTYWIFRAIALLEKKPIEHNKK